MEKRQLHQHCASPALSEDDALFSILWLYGTVAGLHQRQPLQREKKKWKHEEEDIRQGRDLLRFPKDSEVNLRNPHSTGILM